ncbi:flagellar assembly protein FliW [Paenarthrobacter nitroguajacolicus]|uniref:Flagellar assembly protein FliW n=1 Tax=Paenarthrobacter nitroguajacolicus TaxID=211146 RepID=A0A558GS43_PAENT|nr:flagellar assembly protein FliW [Paenarthrobacter nitroguajacolicus]TVU59690.1 flagellar assembly protein FliW [Paenarthrobacter nitroguajacolicus]
MSTALAFDTLTFAAPMPGLESAEGFSLRGVYGAEGLYALEVAEPRVRMFVADAAVYVPDYEPTVQVDVLEALGVASLSEMTVLVVVNPTPEKTTVNLMAPIVLNPANGVCLQVILDGAKYPLRAELAR